MIKVTVPATTANVGPGFDCLGIALSLYNEIEVEEIEEGLLIEVEGRDQEKIEKNKNNLIYQSMLKTFDKIDRYPKGLRIKQYNNIPLARGLGSSAACIVGGIVAANKLMGNLLSQEEVLELAVEIEGHPDNVAPALLGGVVVSCQDEGKTSYVRFPVHETLKFIVAIPEVELSTKASRGVLPESVPFRDAVKNVGKSSLLVAALMSGELEKIPYALQDCLHQPYRTKLMASLETIFSKAEKLDLNQLFLSGAGPSIIYLSWKQEEERARTFINLVNTMPEQWNIKTLQGDNKGTS
ncbi:homoserine kinase ThrB [Clostridium aceticum]|uniref:Homoserine kinase n=1 Tax=Clostridium aceticum TaxID=84022 RepID=A0A0D8I7H7_9CLOT|nr:homoserine kinase [Clostridium aceticum]AKL97165.1 homoserine kinase ThrB [Clostridium aceticum]KJF26203.1 serine kinase [Clostridium aceticum]